MSRANPIYSEVDLEDAVQTERARLLALQPCGHTMAEWVGAQEQSYCRTCRAIEEAEEGNLVQLPCGHVVPNRPSVTAWDDAGFTLTHTCSTCREASAAVTAALEKAEATVREAATAEMPFVGDTELAARRILEGTAKLIRALPRDSSALREREEQAVRFGVTWPLEQADSNPENVTGLTHEQLADKALEVWRKRS